MTLQSQMFTAIRKLPHPEKIKKVLRKEVRKNAGVLTQRNVEIALERLHRVANSAYAHTLVGKYTKLIESYNPVLERHLYAPELNNLYLNDRHNTIIPVHGVRDQDKAIEIAACQVATKEAIEKFGN